MIKSVSKVLMIVMMPVLLCIGCTEHIDESNLYTFTGETIEDFLVNRDDQYSNFNYILSRIGYDKVLSAYGTYTCFAPHNDAVIAYVDSLYDDMSNKELPHNGMTSRGLEGLTDSLCRDIALFHLLYSEVLGVDKILPARFLLPMIHQQIARDIINGSPAVDHTRAVKDAQEIALMKESSLINDRAMAQFKKLIHAGVTEKEVADQTLAIYKSMGAGAFSFPSIVAFGKNAADPHHMPDDTILQEGDTVLFDVGCKYHGYCSDMTRTFFYKKEPTEEQKNIYNLVRRANEEAEAMIRPGVRLCDIDSKARNIITDGGYGPDFTHRLGHFIGIEDHEYGDVSQAFTDPVQPGNIFSIEPGIYHPSILGCRIEDLVLVTEDGHEVLNKYPHEIEIIE